MSAISMVSMVPRTKLLTRDDYKPHKVEYNLRSGRWTLAPNVKRSGFVEILEDGEKIGLVMCSNCGVTCSKNSFRKIRTHVCGKKDVESFSYSPLNGSPATTKSSNANSVSPAAAQSLSNALLLQRQSKQQKAAEPPPKTSLKIEPVSEPIEMIFSRIAAAATATTIPTSTTSPKVSPQTQKQQRTSVPPAKPQGRPTILAKKTPLTPTVSDPPTSSSGNNDGDSLGNMVNSSYRTLANQNRRLAIEFKCTIMNVIAEYEMMMLAKESNE